MAGINRFLTRVYRLYQDEAPDGDAARKHAEGGGSEAQRRLLAKTIDKVTRDYESFDFNTAISQLMVFARDVEKDAPFPVAMAEPFLLLLAPLAPHLCEELWRRLGHAGSLAYEPWPEADPELLVDDEVEIAVQVQGKMRARIRVAADADEEAVLEAAMAVENVAKHVGDGRPRRVIYVAGRLLNIVI